MPGFFCTASAFAMGLNALQLVHKTDHATGRADNASSPARGNRKLGRAKHYSNRALADQPLKWSLIHVGLTRLASLLHLLPAPQRARLEKAYDQD